MRTIKISAHNHTCMSDGYYTVGQLLTILKHSGYDVVAITDHMKHTIPHPLQEQPDILFIDGIEWWHSHLGMEIVSLGFDPKLGDDIILSDAEVSWIAHPKYCDYNISTMMKVIEMFDNVYGLELYNSGELQLTGGELDYLSDYDINYYNVDDCHVSSQIKTSWIEMEVDSLDKHTVLDNLKSGDYWLANRMV